MKWQSYIESNPNILFGKPVIIGTRIPVDLILEKLSNGELFSDLCDAYPGLTEDAIKACLAYASEYVRNHEVLLV